MRPFAPLASVEVRKVRAMGGGGGGGVRRPRALPPPSGGGGGHEPESVISLLGA